MKSKDFFGKIFSLYLVGNLVAMVIVVVLICLGVKYGLDIYTRHGEEVPVPKVVGMNCEEARQLLEQDGLVMMVSDSGYNKRMPADCILLQSLDYGAKVKRGHVVYVTVNSPSSPTFVIPDIIDNSSIREAEAKLIAMGFKVLEPKYVTGEKDWVYGIESRGKRLYAGDHVPIDMPLTLMVGNGQYDDMSADIHVTDANEFAPEDEKEDEFEEVGTNESADDFEEVKSEE